MDMMQAMPPIFLTCLRSMLEFYYQRFLKCDSWASSIHITKELVRKANFGVPPLVRQRGNREGEALLALLSYYQIHLSPSSLLLLSCSHHLRACEESGFRPQPRPCESESAFQQSTLTGNFD